MDVSSFCFVCLHKGPSRSLVRRSFGFILLNFGNGFISLSIYLSVHFLNNQSFQRCLMKKLSFVRPYVRSPSFTSPLSYLSFRSLTLRYLCVLSSVQPYSLVRPFNRSRLFTCLLFLVRSRIFLFMHFILSVHPRPFTLVCSRSFTKPLICPFHLSISFHPITLVLSRSFTRPFISQFHSSISFLPFNLAHSCSFTHCLFHFVHSSCPFKHVYPSFHFSVSFDRFIFFSLRSFIRCSI